MTASDSTVPPTLRTELEELAARTLNAANRAAGLEAEAETRIVAWLRAEASAERSPAEAANFRRSANRIEAGEHRG